MWKAMLLLWWKAKNNLRYRKGLRAIDLSKRKSHADESL